MNPKNRTLEDALSPIDDYATGAAALREKLADAQTPGYQAEFDPEEADRVGAFVEDALSERDAAESGEDLADTAEEEEPAFLDDDNGNDDVPPFITTTNARELYDIQPGETLAEAVARRGTKGDWPCP